MILAMDCATETMGLALLDGEDVQAELYLGEGRHRAEVLLPALEKLLRLAGVSMEKIDLLACTTGPGSFTGVRIGVSTVKGLALALRKPIVGVSTLEALAMNALPSPILICPMLDARRDQVYAGLYRMAPDGFPEAVSPERLTDITQWIHDLPPDKVDVIGSGALRYRMRLLESQAIRCDPDGSGKHRIHASAVGLIGLHRYRKGRSHDPLNFAPKYYRMFEPQTGETKSVE
jgi:tRNA threonylcarbamoyladenosine biosynthesis protein TsaB